ncbi:MAG: proline--tRNA ligase, partial [Fimbriimonadaceae bacterium]|nr:proline--tRNA ligase [Fimbriimonadaceae bacterium]
GQNFAKAFDVTFQTSAGSLDHVYATSWGVSTRLIGTLLMVHSDDKGLVLPPRLAPVQVVIIPIGRGEQRIAVDEAASAMASDLRASGIRVHVDMRDRESPGFKFNDWELKGACVRVELGPRDLEAGQCLLARRDLEEKQTVAISEVCRVASEMLTSMQTDLRTKALALREANTKRVDTWDEFRKCFAGEGGGGFVVAHWDGTQETEDAIAEQCGATIRCIPQVPLDPSDEMPGVCVFSGKPSARRVVFAKAY